jgi:hypothetical protein
MIEFHHSVHLPVVMKVRDLNHLSQIAFIPCQNPKSLPGLHQQTTFNLHRFALHRFALHRSALARKANTRIRVLYLQCHKVQKSSKELEFLIISQVLQEMPRKTGPICLRGDQLIRLVTLPFFLRLKDVNQQLHFDNPQFHLVMLSIPINLPGLTIFLFRKPH